MKKFLAIVILVLVTALPILAQSNNTVQSVYSQNFAGATTLTGNTLEVTGLVGDFNYVRTVSASGTITADLLLDITDLQYYPTAFANFTSNGAQYGMTLSFNSISEDGTLSFNVYSVTTYNDFGTLVSVDYDTLTFDSGSMFFYVTTMTLNDNSVDCRSCGR